MERTSKQDIRPRGFLTLGWGYWWEASYNNLYVLEANGERVAVDDVRLHIRSAAERGEFALAELLQCYADSALPVALEARIADQFAAVGLVGILESVEQEPTGAVRITVCPFLRGLEGLLVELTCIKPCEPWGFDSAGRASFCIEVPLWWQQNAEVTI